MDEANEFGGSVEDLFSYLDSAAGLGAMLETLLRVPTKSINRFLDVGCYAGFALDMARTLFKWEVTGVEPTHAGSFGREVLGLPIASAMLDETLELGAPFELVYSSEVLEHVTNPATFLTALRQRLSTNALLVLTTPSADALSANQVTAINFAILSPGHHVFVASKIGLEQLLSRVGFPHIRVEQHNASLIAFASDQPLQVAPKPSAETVQEHLGKYLSARLGDPTIDPRIEHGLLVRAYRLAVNHGDWLKARQLQPRLLASFRQTFGIILEQTGIESLTSIISPKHPTRIMSSLPGVLTGLGIAAFLNENNPTRARECFLAANRLIADWRHRQLNLDLDTEEIDKFARFHAALAAARCAPEVVVEFFNQFSSKERCRIFTELVMNTGGEHAQTLISAVIAPVRSLLDSSDASERCWAANAIFALGFSELQNKNPTEAFRLFKRCLQIAEQESAWDDLLINAKNHAGLAIEQIGSPILPEVQHAIEVHWCSEAGTYLQGWVATDAGPISSMTLRVAAQKAVPDLCQRPDVAAIFGLGWNTTGFSGYIPGLPIGKPSIELCADGDLHHLTLAIPTEQEIETKPTTSEPDFHELAVANAPDGPILFIGARRLENAETRLLNRWADQREIVSLDIHPGNGVTVVGDAHCLTDIFTAGMFAVVITASVLEHVEAPWLIASQIRQVLKPGGTVSATVPWIWPTHAAPNDFWRMSQSGLEILFGPGMGFEVVASDGIKSAKVYPNADWVRHSPLMPTLASPSMSRIVARRTHTQTPTVAWPYDKEVGHIRASAYPSDGLGAPE